MPPYLSEDVRKEAHGQSNGWKTERDYELLVLGSGPAGHSAAMQAAKLGKKTAIVEHKAGGGALINTGTIPSKTLREAVLHLRISRAQHLRRLLRGEQEHHHVGFSSAHRQCDRQRAGHESATVPTQPCRTSASGRDVRRSPYGTPVGAGRSRALGCHRRQGDHRRRHENDKGLACRVRRPENFHQRRHTEPEGTAALDCHHRRRRQRDWNTARSSPRWACALQLSTNGQGFSPSWITK